MKYIYQHKDWPNFHWSNNDLISLLSKVRNHQGRLIGKMGNLGFDIQNQANLEILTQDILRSSEIEGEILNQDQIRSSIARRLGIQMPYYVDSDRNVDGFVEVMLDATMNFSNNLTKERLFIWHNFLFPTGYGRLNKIIVGNWRDDSTGPMQVVSGPLGKEKVHYQAPPADVLENEMISFLNWINGQQNADLVIKAAVAHLWFITLHPFEDGNGRIARVISDMILAQSDQQSTRFYSMSTQILNERKQYYNILEKTQHGVLDITEWIVWFLNCLLNAINTSENLLSKIVFKHDFWLNNGEKINNERQRKILNMLLDGFLGKLTTSKWAKINKCSQDTALRDIQDLLAKHVLVKLPGGGRSTGYDIRK